MKKIQEIYFNGADHDCVLAGAFPTFTAELHMQHDYSYDPQPDEYIYIFRDVYKQYKVLCRLVENGFEAITWTETPSFFQMLKDFKLTH